MMSPSPSLPLSPDLQPGKPPILLAEVAGDAARWAAQYREVLRLLVNEYGALLVRGLKLGDVAQAEGVFRNLGILMGETESFAPRQQHGNGVYSSTKWPSQQPMGMHHELSYTLEPPGMMLFACFTAPAAGGATSVADSLSVLPALPAELVERFERVGWLLVRNYHDDIGASVADAFGTEDRGAVESYCRDHDIRFEWQPGGGLRTWQRRAAIVRHPLTGQRCWFNQIAFLNQWTLAPEVRERLVNQYGEDGLPFNTRFGNAESIGPDIVRTINQVYQANTAREAWEAGDLLLVDNIRTAHAREPFEGPREVVVGMADAVNLADSQSVDGTAF
jgi:alpha-ketoglutarate-dependent taurine dioxygenase